MTRRKRRIFVLLMTLMPIGFFYAITVVDIRKYFLILIVIALVANVLMQYLQKRLTLSLGSLWGHKDAGLDERQQTIKNQIYRWSYRAMYGISIGISIIASITWLNLVEETPKEAAYLLMRLILCLILLQAWLPQFLVAWLEPDDINAESITAKEAL